MAKREFTFRIVDAETREILGEAKTVVDADPHAELDFFVQEGDECDVHQLFELVRFSHNKR